MPPNRPKNIMTRKRLSPGRRRRRGRGRLKRHTTSRKAAHDTSERTSLPTSALKPRRAQIVRRNDRPAAQIRPKDSAASAASAQSSNGGRSTPTAQAVPLRAKQALRKTNDYSYPADGGCGRTGPSRRAGSCATAECGHRWSAYNPKSHLWRGNPTCVPARCSCSAESRAVALRESASAKMRAGRQMSSSQPQRGRRVPSQMWAL